MTDWPRRWRRDSHAGAFRPDPVPEDVILRIVDMARLAPSWEQHAALGPGDRASRNDAGARGAADDAGGERGAAAPDVAFPPAFAGVYLARRREVGFGLYAAVGVAREDRAGRAAQNLENFRFFGAPHVAVLTMPAGMGPYGALDAGSFLQSFLLGRRGGRASPPSRRPRSPPMRRLCVRCWRFPTTARSCAASRSATPTRSIPPTASAPRARRATRLCVSLEGGDGQPPSAPCTRSTSASSSRTSVAATPAAFAAARSLALSPNRRQALGASA